MAIGILIAFCLLLHLRRSRLDKNFITTVGEDDTSARFALLELY